MDEWRKDTYGKMASRASVIPRPARNTGVRPILGLMVEPVNGPTGDSYGASRLAPGVMTQGWVSDPRERLFLEITGRLDSKNCADVVDPLKRYVIGMCVAQGKRITAPDGIPLEMCGLA